MSFRETVEELRAWEALIEDLIEMAERRLEERKVFLQSLKERHRSVLVELDKYCPACDQELESAAMNGCDMCDLGPEEGESCCG